MEYKKAMEIYQRMCDSHERGMCKQCEMSHYQNVEGLLCIDLIYKHSDIAESILKKWDKEHPKETILTKFLEQYPNAPIGEDGTPTGICPGNLGYTEIVNCSDSYKDICIRCWGRTPEEAEPTHES